MDFGSREWIKWKLYEKGRMTMAKKYDMKGSQLLILPIRDKVWSIHAYSYYFPEALAELLVGKDGKIQREKKYLHLSELNTWILALFPSVFFTQSLYPDSLHRPWILSDRPLPVHELESLLCLWVENHPGCPRFLPSFSVHKKHLQIPCLVDTYANGTANPKCGDDLNLNAFEIWPRYFANRLNGMAYSWEEGGQNVRGKLFTSLSALNRGETRLLSWPPHGKKNNWSFQVKISLQTIPEDSHAYFYLHPQTLRFAENTLLRNRENQISLILGIKDRKGIHSPRFAEWPGVPIARMKDWSPFSKKIGSLFHHEQELPSYQSFRYEPLSNIYDDSVVSILPLYNHRMEWNHNVKPGLSPIDRYHLAEQVKQKLCDIERNFSESWPQREKIIFPSYKKKLFIDQFRLPCTYQLIRLNQEEKTWQEVTARILQEELKLELKDGKYFRKKDQDSVDEVQIIKESAEEFWGPNPYHIESHHSLDSIVTKDEELKNEQARREYAEKIAQKVIQQFPDRQDGQVFALIELPNVDAFQSSQDPKEILRHELAKKGILTQFITPPDSYVPLEDIENQKNRSFVSRCKNGILDMLRQIGVIRWRIDSVLSVPTACVGIYLKLSSSRNQVIPFLTAIFGHQVYAYVEKEGWIPYLQALIQVARQSVDRQVIQQTEVANFIYEAIKQLKRKFSPQHIILYGGAKNLRSYIPWLKNTNITRDCVWLSKDISLDKDVSFVRIRGGGSESPEWVAFGREIDKVKDTNSVYPLPTCLQTHLISWSDRLYWGIAKRPDTARSMGDHIHKMKQDRENVYYRKETAVEIFIPVCNEKVISPMELAIFSQLLRQRATIQHKDYLFAPLPLHLANLMEEYIQNM